MLWFTVWFMVILKIPALYLGYVIWWAVKDPPVEATGGSDGMPGDGGPRRGPRLPAPGRRPGPHGRPLRREARTPPRRERAKRLA